MIVGITGTNGSGKGEVAEYLKTRGFTHYSVREYLIYELEKRGQKPTREHLVLIANQLRARHGPSYIVEQLYDLAVQKGGDAIIESIRTVGEIEALRKKEGFVLFAIDAEPHLRYARINERKASTDLITYEEFLEQEKNEMYSTDENKQNLSACIERADHRIKNDGTKKELHARIAGILGGREAGQIKYQRPGWDEYFMDIARTVAKRGTCDRGRSGCVIAKDKQILVTGYVGSPRGMPHCDEVGHQMEEWEHSDGIKRWHCVRTTHAEQNAICQAAKVGVAIDGATLYCKMTPCSVCAGMIINAGIKRVVCEKIYHAGKTEAYFKQAGVQLEVLQKEIERYEGQ